MSVRHEKIKIDEKEVRYKLMWDRENHKDCWMMVTFCLIKEGWVVNEINIWNYAPREVILKIEAIMRGLNS